MFFIKNCNISGEENVPLRILDEVWIYWCQNIMPLIILLISTPFEIEYVHCSGVCQYSGERQGGVPEQDRPGQESDKRQESWPGMLCHLLTVSKQKQCVLNQNIFQLLPFPIFRFQALQVLKRSSSSTSNSPLIVKKSCVIKSGLGRW